MRLNVYIKLNILIILNIKILSLCHIRRILDFDVSLDIIAIIKHVCNRYSHR